MLTSRIQQAVSFPFSSNRLRKIVTLTCPCINVCSHSRSCASAAYHIVCPSSLCFLHRNRGRHLARSTADLPTATNPSRGLAMGNVVVFASCPSRQDQRVVENLLRLGRPLRPVPSICSISFPACLTYVRVKKKAAELLMSPSLAPTLTCTSILKWSSDSAATWKGYGLEPDICPRFCQRFELLARSGAAAGREPVAPAWV